MAAGEIVTRAMTGHATAAMTEHYSHVSIAEKAKALNAALGSVLGSAGPVQRPSAAAALGSAGVAAGVGLRNPSSEPEKPN
jgi:hypothetical protein